MNWDDPIPSVLIMIIIVVLLGAVGMKGVFMYTGIPSASETPQGSAVVLEDPDNPEVVYVQLNNYGETGIDVTTQKSETVFITNTENVSVSNGVSNAPHQNAMYYNPEFALGDELEYSEVYGENSIATVSLLKVEVDDPEEEYSFEVVGSNKNYTRSFGVYSSTDSSGSVTAHGGIKVLSVNLSENMVDNRPFTAEELRLYSREG